MHVRVVWQAVAALLDAGARHTALDGDMPDESPLGYAINFWSKITQHSYTTNDTTSRLRQCCGLLLQRANAADKQRVLQRVSSANHMGSVNVIHLLVEHGVNPDGIVRDPNGEGKREVFLYPALVQVPCTLHPCNPPRL